MFRAANALHAAALLCASAWSPAVEAQTPAAEVGAAPAWAQAPPASAFPAQFEAPPSAAGDFEINSLYLTAAGYGLTLGVWLDIELGLDDPALILIPPTVLGVTIPAAAYLYAHPRPRRGLPAALVAGTLIGAGQGLGLATMQMTTADDPWGATGLMRSVVVGSTLGGIAGYVAGELERPSPNTSAFVSSGAVWGSLVGAMVGFGVSEAGAPFAETNDPLARGGWIGFNAGLVTTMALSLAFVPTVEQIEWMWWGGLIGAGVSLPAYLLYASDDAPPAKRGLLFTATASTLGILAGGLFGPEISRQSEPEVQSAWVSVEAVAPWALPDGLGLLVSGVLY